MEVLKYIKSQCLFCLAVLLSFAVNVALSDILQSILWAPYNPFFRNLGDSDRTVFLHDKLIFICPNNIIYPTQTNKEYNTNNLYANIYMVDKKGFDNCNATGGKKIVVCDSPSPVKSATVIILKEVPTDSLPQFQPGKVHYFIDTSDGSKNVSFLVGGKCQTNNMKMKVYVCKDKFDPRCPNQNKVTNGGWSSWGECSQSGTQTRQCNNPAPSNGGFRCQGNHSRVCTIPDISTTPTVIIEPNNNKTITPKKDKRTSVADTLGTLSVGAVVGIFIAIFIFGCILGLFIGLATARVKSRGFSVRRRNGNLVEEFNRNSIRCATPKSRPFSTISSDTTLTNITTFASYNDIYNEVK